MYISEVEKRTGATQRAIRLYESLGLFRVPRSGKYRIYNDKHVEQINIIKQAQALDIQLSDLVALKSDTDDLDWHLVSQFLFKQEVLVAEKIRDLQTKKQRIAEYREIVTACLKNLDSDL